MGAMSVFWVHTVQVETRIGQNAIGDVWADPVTVSCFVNDQTHLVRSQHDEEVVSQSIVYAPIDQAALFAADSKVTVSGRVARVITTNANDGGTLPLPSHVEVHLT
jgi:hypothetical protein